MTFSDSKVSNYLQKNFISQWEAVSPVRLVHFDLGEGRSFSGTVNGEIALYFCDSEGKVFDILPALQSPAITLKAIKSADTFFRAHGGNISAQAVRKLHYERLKKVAGQRYDTLQRQGVKIITDPNKIPAHLVFPETKKGEEKRDSYIRAATDDATRDMRTMTFSKVGPPPNYLRTGGFSEAAMTVVEPGGLGYYQWQIDRAFLNNWPAPPISIPALGAEIETSFENFFNFKAKTPEQWKVRLFTGIMKQELRGGVVEYNSESLEAIQLIE